MIINRFNEANEYTLLERVKDTFTNLIDEHKGITIIKSTGNTIKVNIPGIVGNYDRKGNKRTNPKYTFDDYLYFTNTWNEILLDVQVIIKYLSTLEIMHKLEYSIDYRHIKILFFINTEISNIAMKVNPKSIIISKSSLLRECNLTTEDIDSTDIDSDRYGNISMIFKYEITEEQLRKIEEVFLKYGITTQYRKYPSFPSLRQLQINFSSNSVRRTIRFIE
jgi:hypothetical protein